jgi:hypothetical protein
MFCYVPFGMTELWYSLSNLRDMLNTNDEWRMTRQPFEIPPFSWYSDHSSENWAV